MLSDYRMVNKDFSNTHCADSRYDDWYISGNENAGVSDSLSQNTKIVRLQLLGEHVEMTVLSANRNYLDFTSHQNPPFLKSKRLKSVVQELTNEDKVRSIQRSKTMIRYKIKQLSADRMLTLTIRESDNFTSVAQWAVLWRKFTFSMKRHYGDFHYVAVLEKHKKGNYHLHAAINRYYDARTLRTLWHECVGLSQGNVDLTYKSSLSPSQRVLSVSKYLSKYISKQLTHSEFNKKRYWSSRVTIAKPRYYILAPGVTPLDFVSSITGLSHDQVQSTYYQYSDESDGFWLAISITPTLKSQL